MLIDWEWPCLISAYCDLIYLSLTCLPCRCLLINLHITVDRPRFSVLTYSHRPPNAFSNTFFSHQSCDSGLRRLFILFSPALISSLQSNYYTQHNYMMPSLRSLSSPKISTLQRDLLSLRGTVNTSIFFVVVVVNFVHNFHINSSEIRILVSNSYKCRRWRVSVYLCPPHHIPGSVYNHTNLLFL